MLEFKDALKPIRVEYPDATASASDVLRDIDQLRRDLSGYHGQLKAHNDLQRHCDNQRKRITELEGLYAEAKAENKRLRELVNDLYVWFVIGHDWGPYCAGETAMVEERMRELGMIE